MKDLVKYNIVRSSRKTLSIEIRKDASVLVRAPLRMPLKDIEQFINKKSDWIIKHTAMMEERMEREEGTKKLSYEEIRDLADKAMKVIPEKTKHYAAILGVTYGRITIRSQRTRWGSCSAKGNLNFNCLLMLMPDEILDYVIVHELSHRKKMNHSEAFWNIVASVLPDYKNRQKWLKDNGPKYMGMQG